MEFREFKDAVHAQFDSVSDGELFLTNIEKDVLWETYLGSFPEGSNPIFRERTQHDCNCCKQFIRACGNVVSIVDNKLVSIWDVEVGGEYQVVANALSEVVKSKFVRDSFLSQERKLGTDFNHQHLENGDSIKFEHFYYQLPKRFVKKEIATDQGNLRSGKDVFKRGLSEITLGSAEIVLELIEQNSLYRGEEHKSTVELFIKHKKEFDEVSGDKEQDNYCWLNSVKLSGKARIRNSAIGTLLVDISDGVELDRAVASFESKVAPTNYKRPSAVVTQSMIKKAQEKVQELGIESALSRRYAVTEDITINNVLFADRSAKQAMSVFDEIAKEAPSSVKNLDKVEEVGIEFFVESILPKVDSIELMVENKHENNFVSLIAPVHDDAKSILKWGNNFSWSYNGEVADSDLRDQVSKRGGRVDGVFRFSHTWNYNKRNASLMDLHVFMPGNGNNAENGRHDKYGNNERVGWNNRNHYASGGVQDVDYVTPAPVGYVPVENITFPLIDKMPEGKYVCKIHNWNLRNPTQGGFKAEIEFGGNIYQYEYDKPLAHKEWVTVAEVTLKNKEFSIKHCLKESQSTKEVWGVNTHKFHKVKMLMNSPNHWDGEKTGNKHWFFMLEDCKQSGKARGFFNEFLKDDLHDHRKVLEVLGAKMKAEESDNQLSGLGFSSTQRNSVYCKVSGSFTRTLKINF